MFGRITAGEVTQAQYDAVAPEILADIHRSVKAQGKVNMNITFGLERHASLTANLIGEWLHGVEDAVILQSLYWLGNVAAGYLKGSWSREHRSYTRCDISQTAHQGWARAARVHRVHIPADTTYRLTLPVEKVQGVVDWEPVANVRKNSAINIRLVCTHWSARGYLAGTPYYIDLKRVGRAHGPWKVTRAAHEGIASIVARANEEYESDISGWEAVFESTRVTRQETDWRDGRETFTSTDYKLHPGKVVSVRRVAPGNEKRFRILPEVALPEGSMHTDLPFHRLFDRIRRLEAVEAIAASEDENGS
ncbi:MAG: hypothetical protein VX223_01680 [Myxococcota bacterium]|nr:hypothetical protein [Myxococcota bacterium]